MFEGNGVVSAAIAVAGWRGGGGYMGRGRELLNLANLMMLEQCC